MLQVSHDVALLVARERIDRDLDRMVTECHLCEAGLRQRGWMLRQLCRTACVLGRVLVATGQRLEHLNNAEGQIRLAQAPRVD